MAKINTPITGEDKNAEIDRSFKALKTAKQEIATIVNKGKQVYSITMNGTTILTTDLEKWNNHFGVKQVVTA